jgi:hypothetical protein
MRTCLNFRTKETRKEPFLYKNSCSVSQEIPRNLCKSKVYYRVHKSSPLIPISKLMIPVRNLPPYFFKLHFNITFPSTPKSSLNVFRSQFCIYLNFLVNYNFGTSFVPKIFSKLFSIKQFRLSSF